MYQKMLEEKTRLEKEILNLQKKLKKLPAGSLICSEEKDSTRYYRCCEGKREYLPKSSGELIKQLALKKYYQAGLKDCTRMLRATEHYLKSMGDGESDVEKLTGKNQAYKDLLAFHFSASPNCDSIWENVPYIKSSEHPEHLVHKTLSDHMVRSKSEALIDMALFLNRIPYRYECLLQLGEHSFFPDFTIRHPKTGQIFYWEHLGMMDNPGYIRKNCHKLQIYCEHGIIPSIQLITTYETDQHPLSSQQVDEIIQTYFL